MWLPISYSFYKILAPQDLRVESAKNRNKAETATRTPLMIRGVTLNVTATLSMATAPWVLWRVFYFAS
jgi:hypothetical protein